MISSIIQVVVPEGKVKVSLYVNSSKFPVNNDGKI
jgi:hypothetical protein